MRRLAAILLLVSTARAADVPCGPAEQGTISMDGLIDDWREVEPLQSGDDDAGISLRCNTEGKTLYLGIEATDQRVVRTKQARAGEDHVDLTIGSKHWTIFPAEGANKAKVTPGGMRVASASSDKGFVVEVALPMSALGKKPDRVPFSLRFSDCDAAATLKTERTAEVGGELAFTSGMSALDSFLSEHALSRSLVRWQHPVRTQKGTVQLVLAGKFLVAVSDAYAFVELPVADGKDVQPPELVDLLGDGRQAVALRYTERGEGGSREVLAIFRPKDNQLERVLAVEVGKKIGGGTLSSKAAWKKRGKGTDLVLDAQPAQNLTEASYKEAPADDLVPILLPWSADKHAAYGFTSDGYVRR